VWTRQRARVDARSGLVLDVEQHRTRREKNKKRSSPACSISKRCLPDSSCVASTRTLRIPGTNCGSFRNP